MPNELTDKLELARAAKAKAKAVAAENEYFRGVGIGRKNGNYMIKVYISEQSDQALQLPTEIDGIAVEVKLVGKISKSRKLK